MSTRTRQSDLLENDWATNNKEYFHNPKRSQMVKGRAFFISFRSWNIIFQKMLVKGFLRVGMWVKAEGETIPFVARAKSVLSVFWHSTSRTQTLWFLPIPFFPPSPYLSIHLSIRSSKAQTLSLARIGGTVYIRQTRFLPSWGRETSNRKQTIK